MKKIVVICDSFKECMSSLEIGCTIRKATLDLDPRASIRICPVSDGGEGLIEAVLSTGHFTVHSGTACDPFLHPQNALWASDDQGAVIEMARCSGLSLCQPRDPMKTSTFGTGLQILDALNQGFSTVWLGLGGSGTHDCGCGIASALGVRFLHRGKEFLPVGATLDQIDTIDLSGLSEKVRAMKLICCCDVDNPVCGPQGAAAVFARQKGADDQQIRILEHNTCSLASLVEKQLHIQIKDQKKLGAAGACGLMLKSVFDCSFVSGLQQMLQWIDPHELFLQADLVITGEGKIDEQSLHGKVPFGVLELARQTHTPVLAVCGQLGIDQKKLKDAGFCDVLILKDKKMTVRESIEKAPELLEKKWIQWLQDRKEESL